LSERELMRVRLRILEEETRDGKEGTIKKSTSNARILLTPSRVEFHPSSPPSTLQHTILTALSFFGLTSLSYSSSSSSHKTLSQTQTQKQKQNKEREITSFTNLTLPNVILIWFGPLTEEGVVVRIAVVQVLGSCVAFGVRYGLAGLVYDGDRK
jgi:UDP-N-acetylglucosamine--dolichyl-phosphate N-acetylglucosaminephosphotransferase